MPLSEKGAVALKQSRKYNRAARKGLPGWCFHSIIHLTKTTQKVVVNYTMNRSRNQVVLPLDLGIKIQDSDPVRKLVEIAMN